MNNTVLQIPIDKKLKEKATKASKNMGFSSLQEVVRVFLHQISENTTTAKFEEKSVQLSPRAIKRYDKMIDDYDSGKYRSKAYTSVNELMKDLNS